MPEFSDEITFKIIILKIKAWWQFLISRWMKLLLIGMIGGILGVIYAYLSKPSYKAKLSFVLSAGEGGKMSGLSGLAGQFGLDIAGASNNDVFSGDNITGLLTSRRMMQKALFRVPEGSNQMLINIITQELMLDKRWRKNERTKKEYPFPAQPSLLTLVQDSLCREIYDIVVKEIISINKPDKKQSIFVAQATFSNELVSVFLPKYLVNETAQFYIATKTKVALENLSMIQHEADSLRGLLRGTITSTASSIDKTFNLNSAYQVQRVGVQEGQMNMTVITTAYGEVLKNLEVAKITLQKETPLFQIIDEPSLPLKVEKIGKLKALVVGGIIALILGIVFLTIKRVYQLSLS